MLKLRKDHSSHLFLAGSNVCISQIFACFQIKCRVNAELIKCILILKYLLISVKYVDFL